ncbi:MAG: Lrp/AsnC family transcriptional regulator [Euryarchaeota archaeon]|jgi:DNA-binding Lrp family transcriptional regulator|nr:Lrp/AsnC family transcriptional regulator [Euryarchaeota archaeon]
MLDDKDALILRELRKNAKMTTKQIAENTGIPRTTVHDRIGKMEVAGIVRKYTVIPSYESIGEATTAFVFISYDQAQRVDQRVLATQVASVPGVYEVHLISGDWDLIVKVRGKDVESIGNLVMEKLRALEGIQKTLTSTVFKTIKEEV